MAAARARKVAPSGSARANKAAPATKKAKRAPTPAVLVYAATVRAETLKTGFAPLCGPELRLVEDPALLARRGENGPVLALMSTPLAFVAARLEEGLSPAAAMDAWADIATQLRKLNKARRKVVLLDDRALVAPDPGLPAVLADRLGFAIELPKVSEDAAPAAPASALAYALLTTDPELMESVEAWQQGVLGAEGIGFGREDARLAAQAWQPAGVAQASADRAALLQEINAQQVSQIEAGTRRIAELEVQVEQGAGVQAEETVLRASIEALERRLAEAEARRRGLETVLGAQILTDGAALQAAEGEAGQLRAELDAVRQELEQAHAQMNEVCVELEKVFASKSWRMTEVFRASRRFLGR